MTTPLPRALPALLRLSARLHVTRQRGVAPRGCARPRNAASAAMASRYKPAVVTVGDELVMGERPTNSNERWLCAQLTARGHPARVVLQLPDDAAVIGLWLQHLLTSGHTPVLCAGGMGGTHDDKTREGVALALGVPLERHAACDVLLAAKYAASADGLGYTEERQRMAMLPRGAELVANPIGAPGLALRGVYAFPGFPSMLHPMATAVLDGLMPPPADADARVTLEAALPLTEAALAMRCEAFAAAWSAAQLGIYPSDAQFGKLVKLRLRVRARCVACLCVCMCVRSACRADISRFCSCGRSRRQCAAGDVPCQAAFWQLVAGAEAEYGVRASNRLGPGADTPPSSML
jgi:molybdopterin-biosynthesis enzyme MoeA-like protein